MSLYSGDISLNILNYEGSNFKNKGKKSDRGKYVYMDVKIIYV